ncbi:hypothetical protein ACQKKX_00610 [Neorhizobium sp. NPDC001467]|uniref:hypothetical protein n=1 Tax=Neorhizobium sp. NPDC001467 TaxID=3390595 RepID=UPI003D04C7DA
MENLLMGPTGVRTLIGHLPLSSGDEIFCARVRRLKQSVRSSINAPHLKQRLASPGAA